MPFRELHNSYLDNDFDIYQSYYSTIIVDDNDYLYARGRSYPYYVVSMDEDFNVIDTSIGDVVNGYIFWTYQED